MFVGYRTITLTQGLLLHPLDLLLWAYVLVAAVQGQTVIRNTPGAVLWFLLLSLLSAFTSNKPTPVIVSDVKALLLILPVFALVREMLMRGTLRQRAMKAFFGVAVVTSILGAFEYHFPSLARSIPFFGDPDASYSYGGFYRAKFSFFGNPIASILPVFALALTAHYRQLYKKFFFYITLSILLYGIFIGGYRSFWGVTIAAVLINLILNKQKKLILLIPVIALLTSALGYTLVPSSAVVRFISAFSALSGEAELGEESGGNRIEMINSILSWDKLTEHFFGHGLGAAGWVHSDLLMIAYNSGIITAVILAIFLIRTFWQLYKYARKPNADKLSIGLFAAVPAVIMIFLFQSFIVLPQLAVPLYFMMGLMYYYPKIISTEDRRRKQQLRIEQLSTNQLTYRQYV